MRGLLYDGDPNAGWIFLLLTIVLGGAAAWSAGRALALTWRPIARVPVAMLALSLAVCFLHYALFGESRIPLARLAAAIARIGADPDGSLIEIATSLRYWLVTFVILAAVAAAGFRVTRIRQMRRQYPWVSQDKPEAL